MQNKWMTREEFEKTLPEGLCWIAYKGNVHSAYYYDGSYWFHKHGTECYLSECILYVMPIDKPNYPRIK